MKKVSSHVRGRAKNREVGYLLGLVDGGHEAERLVDEADVVVDRFGDAHDRDLEPAPADLFKEGLRAAVRAVAADDVDLREAVLDDAIDDLVAVEAAWQRWSALVLGEEHKLRTKRSEEREGVLRERIWEPVSAATP